MRGRTRGWGGSPASLHPFRVARYENDPVLLCDHGDPSIVFIGDILNADGLSPKVREVLIYTLASNLALPLTEGMRRAQEFEKRIDRAMQEAMLADAAEGLDIIRPDDTYERERHGLHNSWENAWGRA